MRENGIERDDMDKGCLELELFETSEMEQYLKDLPYRMESVFLVCGLIVLNRLSLKKRTEAKVSTEHGMESYVFIGDEPKTVDTILREMDKFCMLAECEVQEESFVFSKIENRYVCTISSNRHDKDYF